MLKISNVKKNYGKTEVLKDINIKASKGDFLFIIGYSGCGKTTLLNIVAGLQGYDEGTITINDKKVSSNDLIKNTSYIFQDYKLIDNFNVLENLSITTNKSEKEITDVLKSLGIDELKKSLVKNISGGQKQRVAIARAILKDTDIILCDEPTGNLDKNNSIEVFKLLKETFKDKLVIIVSHNKKLAKQYATDIIDLDTKKVSYESNNKNELIISNKNRNIKNLNKLTTINIRRNLLRVLTYSLITFVALFSLMIQFELRGSSYEKVMLSQVNEKYILDRIDLYSLKCLKEDHEYLMTQNQPFKDMLLQYENIKYFNIVSDYPINTFYTESDTKSDLNKLARLIDMDRNDNSVIFENIIVGTLPKQENDILVNFDSFLILQNFEDKEELINKYYNNKLSNEDIIKLYNEKKDIYVDQMNADYSGIEKVKISISGIVNTKEQKYILQTPTNQRKNIIDFYPDIFINSNSLLHNKNHEYFSIYLKDNSIQTRIDTLSYIEEESRKLHYDLINTTPKYLGDTVVVNNYYFNILEGINTYRDRSNIIIIVTFIITFISIFITFVKRKENYLKYKRFLYKDKHISYLYNVEYILIILLSSTIVVSLYFLTYYNLSNLMFGLNIQPSIKFSLIFTIVGTTLLLYVLSSIISHLIYYTKFKLKLK